MRQIHRRPAVVLFLLALLVVCGSQAWATTFYFSNCASGGTGTISDPYCLNANASGNNESVMYLFDGTGTEAAAGDTITLCCGGTAGCEDAGSACTYTVHCQGGGASPYWLSPDLDATGNPITIQGLTGDTVTISGDVDGDDMPDTGTCGGSSDTTTEMAILINIVNRGGYHFKNLKLEKAYLYGLYLDNGGDVEFDGVTLTKVGDPAWDDDGAPGVGDDTDPAKCTVNDHDYALYLTGLTGDFTYKNGTIAHICNMVIRNTISNGANHTLLMENNDIYDVESISNHFFGWSWLNNRGQTTIWRKNRFDDWRQGIAIEEHNKNVTIEDNDFNCSATWDISSADWGRYECASAIEIDSGQNSPQNERRGANAGIVIRRNKIHGARQEGDNRATQLGWLSSGITWTDTCRRNTECVASGDPWCCCTGSGAGCCNSGTSCGTCADASVRYGCDADVDYGDAIENNMIWSTYAGLSGCTRGVGITIDRNAAVKIQNNTIVKGQCNAVSLNDGLTNNGVSHVLRDNLLVDTDAEEILIDSSAGIGSISNNDAYDNAGNVYVRGGTTKTCGTFPTDIGSNNICTEPNLLVCDVSSAYCATVDSVEANWNLHLESTDTVCKDTGIAAASDDYDKQARPSGSATDIGADELVTGAATRRKLISSGGS